MSVKSGSPLPPASLGLRGSRAAAWRQSGMWQDLFPGLICLRLMLTSAGAENYLTQSQSLSDSPATPASLPLSLTPVLSWLDFYFIFNVGVAPQGCLSLLCFNESGPKLDRWHIPDLSYLVLYILGVFLKWNIQQLKRKMTILCQIFGRKISGREIFQTSDRCYVWVTTRSCKSCIMLWMLWLIQVGQKQEFLMFLSFFNFLCLKSTDYLLENEFWCLCDRFSASVALCLCVKEKNRQNDVTLRSLRGLNIHSFVI